MGGGGFSGHNVPGIWIAVDLLLLVVFKFANHFSKVGLRWEWGGGGRVGKGVVREG